MTRKILSIFAFVFVSWSFNCFAAATVPLYTDDFGGYTNSEPLINGTNQWYSSSWTGTDGVDVVAMVLTNVVSEGSTNSAAAVPLDVTLSNRYEVTNSANVWLHMQSKIVRYDGSANVAYDTNSTAIFYVDSNGYCVVRNGTSEWVTVTNTLTGQPADPINTNVFNTIDVYLNYTNKTWRLNVNSIKLTNNIGFINTTPTNLTKFDVYNAGFTTSYLDNVVIYNADMLPTLSVNPAIVSNEALFQIAAPDKSFEVRSSGDGDLSYYIVTNTATTWLRITNAAAGTLTDYATNTVWLKYYTESMSPGLYYGSFGVISTNLEGQSNDVQLVLNIKGMTISTNNLTSSKMIGYAAGTQTFDIVQTGTGSLYYVVSTNPVGASWLSVSQSSGTITNNETNTISVSYFTNSLTAGTAMATIEVATASGGGVTQFVSVTMNTYSQPLPTTTSTNYSQTIQKGQIPVSTTVGVWNAGAAPMPRMSYTVASNVSWLTVNPSGGMTYSNETNLVVVNFGAAMTNYAGLSNGYFTVRGVDAGLNYTPIGYITNSTQVTFGIRIIAPGKPGGLTATKGTSANSVNLAWNTTTNCNHFELWQGTNSSVAYATRFVSSVSSNTTSYADTGVSPGIINYYWVRAINAYGGDGAYSDPDTGWMPLSGPTGLTASDGLYTNRVALSWTASVGAQNYEIWRGTINLTNTASLLTTVSSVPTTYDDTSAVVETVYYYWIKSRTPYMASAFGDSDTGYRAALMQPTGVLASDGEFTNKVRVIWQAVEKASSYKVWRNTSDDRSGAIEIGETTSSGYDDQSVTQGTYFYYWIRAASYEGYSRYSDSDYGWRQLVAPGGIAASDGIYPYRVKVSWTASENAIRYEVWRGQGTGIGGNANAGVLKVSETVSTYYNDHATIINTPYYYKVRAMSALGGASDYSSSDFGWREIAPATTTLPVKNDFDGDHLSDLPLYNSTSGVWQVLCSVIGQYDLTFGGTNSHGVQGDYDGDGLSDPMIYQPEHGLWFVMLSSIGYSPIIAGSFGRGLDSAPADYDGDGVTDLVVYNETSGNLSILFSNGGAFNSAVTVSIGGTGWAIASADYDGDGKADPAVYSGSSGQLIAKLSTSGYATVVVPIGGLGITMHPADFDGDGKADLVTYAESTGNWIAKLSSAGYASIPITMGGAGYRPILADYDGDSKTDPAVYSESTGNWLIRFSASGYPLIEDTFGGTNCLPVGR